MIDAHCKFEVTITENDIALFSKLSGDCNPLHMDAAYAKTTEFGRPIAHGAFLVGFVSRVLGMNIPGKKCLILSMKVVFPRPLFYPSKVEVQGNLVSFNPDRNTGTVHVKITELEKRSGVLEAD